VVMREMQDSLSARVELTTRVSGSGEKEALVWKATAYPYMTTSPEARQSVSLSATILTSSAPMTAAAIYRLLIALDYEVSKAWALRVAT
jgi:hypothetical protein